MKRFYQKPWFFYAFPFLVSLTLSEATVYLTNWQHQLFVARILLTAGLLWTLRKKFSPVLQTALGGRDLLTALLTASIVAAIWFIVLENDPSTVRPLIFPAQWPPPLVMTITPLLALGYSFVLPILEELFWRSFMLRYLIDADFSSVPLGHFQAFSFFGVAALTALPSHQAIVPVALSAAIYNLILIWRKNLRCCIVAHILANTLVAGFLLYRGQIWY
ncbi:MAG: CAAX prenyl protease-related protein [Desulfuromonadaceae bacterium]|nr:CAAX prenyl protease-related protein [Desulfuromonadaceae bacterium]